MRHLMGLELTREGLLVYLSNHYTTRGALADTDGCRESDMRIRAVGTPNCC